MPLHTWQDLIDSAGDAGKAFTPIPVDTYNLVIEDAELRTASTGKTGYNLTTVVEDGQYKGRKVFHTFWLNPESNVSMGIFFRHFAAFGLDREYFKSEPSDEKIVADLKNRRFRGNVVIETYNSTERNAIKDFVAPQGAQVAPAANSGVPTALPTASADSDWGTPAATVPAVPATPAPTTEDPWAGIATPAAPTAPATPAPPVAPPAPPLGGPSPF